MKNFVKNLSDGGLAEDTYAFMERVLEEVDKTREEERLGAAFEFYDKHKSAVANVTLVDSFVYGSKWADKHPKPGTVNKQEFIEKAKAWIKNCFTGPFAEGMADNIADEFEKYMEK